ncbi:MAG: class IV adenylate cyclase [Chloroflexota bacterium]|nr:class IV adenylate cyclase [Chloroflexota bacterium]
MSDKQQEIEAKFYVRDLDRIISRLNELEARLIQRRVLETNLRFDLPDGSLRSEGRVLRLRRDTEARFTYKGPSTNEQGVLSRTEIEFTVGDFEKAKEFMEALGYQKLLYYDKYRTTYILESTSLLVNSRQQAVGLQSCHIMLDELPYGNFVEIEGENSETIRAIADQLNLNWDTAIGTSYTTLFERARKTLRFVFRDLSFENFAGMEVNASHLGVRAADA